MMVAMGAVCHTCHTRDHLEYCALVADEIERFASLTEGADPGAQVPTCPEWTVRELVEHAGSIHRWAAHMVANRSPQRASFREVDRAIPASPEGLPAWLREGAAILVDACKGADPDDEMWAWGADQHVRFWSRRMLLETAVHRADLAFATKSRFDAGSATAIDGVDELLDNLPSAAYFAPKVDDLRGAGETLCFAASDTGTSWRVTLEPDRFWWEHDGIGADVTVRAGPLELLLVLYGRRPVSGPAVAVEGDRDLLARWLDNSAL